MYPKILYFACLFHISNSIYYAEWQTITEIRPHNIERAIHKSKDIWILEFYTPWCDECKEFVNDYLKLCRSLNNVLKCGAVDMSNYKEIGRQFKLRTIPTTIFLGQDRTKPIIYKGKKKHSAMLDEVLEFLREEKLNIAQKEDESKAVYPNIIQLTGDNFDTFVTKDETKTWMVMFFAPWCGYCKHFAPIFDEASKQINGKVKFGAVDITMYKNIAEKYEITSLPTVKMFGFDKSATIDFKGNRTTEIVVAWTLDLLAEFSKPIEIKQLINNAGFTEQCLYKPLCVIAVYPRLTDCRTICRNAYLKTLSMVAKVRFGTKWGWLWTEISAQKDLDNVLALRNYDPPTLLIFNAQKMVYQVFYGVFDIHNIKVFIDGISDRKNKGNLAKIDALPKIESIKPWDGKDSILKEL